MKKLEYVLSGTSYLRLTNPYTMANPESIARINKIFDKFFTEDTGHTFSILYNALCEKNYGAKLQSFSDHIHKIHADSGGLQAITVGKKITPEVKKEVYANQAEWADVGMCFDQIPVVTQSGRSDRNDTTGRFFDRVNFHKYAKETGENVRDQLAAFKSKKSKCKPFVILQGNDIETFLEWADIILKSVPKDQVHMIGGVAMGAAALGTGNMEDIIRAYAASEVPIRDENGILNLHILGVGSIRRMLPYLIFQSSGLYKDFHISYDSTTHSRGVETGLYYILGGISKTGTRTHGPGSTLKFGRDRAVENPLPGFEPLKGDPSADYLTVYNDINSIYDMGVSLDELHEILNTPASKWVEKYGVADKWSESRVAFAAGSVRNFMIEIDKLLKYKDYLLEYATSIKAHAQYNALYSVKDRKSFYDNFYNARDIGSNIKSVRISDTVDSAETIFS